MYGDSEIIRRRARQLRDQGADVRALADELVARVEGLGWTGRAGEAMRARVTERAHHLRVAAERHVGAADALSDHAARVDEVRDEIAATQARVTTLVADARARITALAARASADGTGDGTREGTQAAPSVTPDSQDEALAAFVPPPEGHRDWLTAEVPGLER